MVTMVLLVLLDLLVPLVRKESRDPLVLLVSRVFLAPLDLLVRLASLVIEVSLEIKVYQDLLV